MKYGLKGFIVLITLLFAGGSLFAATTTGPSGTSTKNRSSTSSSKTRTSTNRNRSSQSRRPNTNRNRSSRNRSSNRSSSSGTKPSGLGVKLDSSSDLMTSRAESRYLGYYNPSLESEVLIRAEEHASSMVKKEGQGEE